MLHLVGNKLRCSCVMYVMFIGGKQRGDRERERKGSLMH